MTATERSFSDFPPSHLYLDTNILIGYLFGSDPFHGRCRTLLEKVAGLGLTTIYISSLSWIEFAHVVMRPRFRAALPASTKQSFRLDRWHERSVRERYLEEYRRALEVLLSHFELEEVRLTPEVRTAALTYMVEYDLDGQDAVHAASAELAGVHDLASFDRAFRRIDGLSLWNDLLYAGEPV